MNNCIKCGKETSNPKFCSRSCAAIFNNSKSPKRKLNRKCLECNEVVMSHRHNRCKSHYENYKTNKYRNKTIGEYRECLSVNGKHKSWLHAHIRNFARSWLKHLREEPCRFCGYDKHVELAHIHPLSEFDDNTLLSVVNSESNVLPLCPNCHWEFDNLPRKAVALSIELKADVRMPLEATESL